MLILCGKRKCAPFLDVCSCHISNYKAQSNLILLFVCHLFCSGWSTYFPPPPTPFSPHRFFPPYSLQIVPFPSPPTLCPSPLSTQHSTASPFHLRPTYLRPTYLHLHPLTHLHLFPYSLCSMRWQTLSFSTIYGIAGSSYSPGLCLLSEIVIVVAIALFMI